ncbi:type-F conjugative transfer system secretin TraK [Novosphingobium sp. P6W]|uniref:type-F conjugative transfer system secretin TraK n=1 Tax=Novosphingobium sp. P6W TaxID=1609758 RepID=UPI0005C75F0A|nr:type-F conjugative transfer system secretin TraK [Novosphingobium sp. P6W]AXB80455.1 conjugal transfer protein TraK [Novosphingobium sp. P6W]
MTGLLPNVVPACAVIFGTALASSMNCMGRRALGAGVMGWGLISVTPALADQTVVAIDNGAVECEASRQDLTRISLRNDQFAAVSKVSAGRASEDFSVVHEPTRGDVYISVPEGYTRSTISFFGTTRKGFVYKFTCKVGGSDAKQVFVANGQAEKPAEQPAAYAVSELPFDEQVLALVRAMFEQKPLPGFEIRDRPRAAVNVGGLKVQLVSEYRGLLLTGQVLRVQNAGKEPMVLSEDIVASRGAIAVSVSNSSLGPGQTTGAYVVLPAGDL